MNINKSILWLTLVSFLLLGTSGLILFFSFEEDVFRKVLGFNKSKWIDFHMMIAVLNILLIAYHVGSRWRWVEKYIIEFGQHKTNQSIQKKQISNALMILVFTISLFSGFLGWILSGECDFCLVIHKYTGLVFLLSFLYHLFIHRRGLR